MKPRTAIRTLSAVALAAMIYPAAAYGQQPRFRHVTTQSEKTAKESLKEPAAKRQAAPEETETTDALPLDSLLPRTVEQILEELPPYYPYMRHALRAAGPWVISGYRPIPEYTLPIPETNMRTLLGHGYTTFADGRSETDIYSFPKPPRSGNGLFLGDDDFEEAIISEQIERESLYPNPEEERPEDEAEPDPPAWTLYPIVRGEFMPAWLREIYVNRRIQEDMMYKMMVENPHNIEYAYWDLPVPPRLPEEDQSFTGFLRKLNLPEIDPSKAVIPKDELGRYNWLHTINGGLQISQTYLSRNWYQGGNNYLAVLLNLLWEVNLNQVYHPNLMMQSQFSYKLGMNTTPKSSMHKYQINTDQLQWNYKAGLKAFTKWYYSFNLLFKTQLLLNLADDSDAHKASFLSPGELNFGLGMTYNHQNKPGTFKMSLSISPVSYNIKTCIDRKIDPTQYKIEEGHRSVHEFGSNIECNYEWRMHSNVFWRSRFFLFSDYKSMLGDWENTFEFTINKFLSTQLFFHLRYDSSTPLTFQTGWGKWQFKEILSFGLSYTFTTKP